MFAKNHHPHNLIIMVLISAAVLAATVVLVRDIFSSDLHTFLKERYLDVLGFYPLLMILLFLFITVMNDSYIRPDLKRIMFMIIVVVSGLAAQNYLDYRLADGGAQWLARTLVAIFGYSLRPLILILFLHLTAPGRPFLWAWVLAFVNALIYTTALFSHICFWIDDKNHWQGGPLHDTALYISMILLTCWFVMTLRMFEPQMHRETWIPVLIVPTVISGIALDSSAGLIAQPVSFLTMAVVVSCVAYYIWLHLQYVREHEEAMMAGQRVQLMLSQIKPHFLYNSLAVIAELCDLDPELAKSTTIKFSNYLRGNMKSIDETRGIRFEEELNHTRIYLEIEKLRFGDALSVHYDIRSTAFTIPALTVEPLVENAVRHGVRQNPGGRGTVTIISRKLNDHYEVTVMDDGPGFDPSQLSTGVAGDNQPHVGIVNVRERLMQVCGGSLVIESAPGHGTRATILLPGQQDI